MDCTHRAWTALGRRRLGGSCRWVQIGRQWIKLSTGDEEDYFAFGSSSFFGQIPLMDIPPLVPRSVGPGAFTVRRAFRSPRPQDRHQRSMASVPLCLPLTQSFGHDRRIERLYSLPSTIDRYIAIKPSVSLGLLLLLF